MSAFIKSLKKRFPDKKKTFLIGMKRGKEYKKILKYILPEASKIILTNFSTKQNHFYFAEDPIVLEKIIKDFHFIHYRIVTDPHEALKILLEEKENLKVVTGSLYLISEIYKDLKKI